MAIYICLQKVQRVAQVQGSFNMTTLFQKLQYNFDDPNKAIEKLPDETLSLMNQMPPMIEPWQTQDLADNNVGGYFQDPTSTVVANIKSSYIQLRNYCLTANGLLGTSGDITSTFASIAGAGLNTVCDTFSAHTGRISGVLDYEDYLEDTTGIISTKPFYETAMNMGKSAMYIMNQTDGIEDNSPMMGSFTSLFVVPQIEALYAPLPGYVTLLGNSITLSTVEGGTPEEPTSSEVATSSLTSTQATAISNKITEIVTLLNTRRSHDETFYTNLKNFMADYNKTRQFSKMGDTQTSLVNNYIGTNKIKTRINS